MYRSLSTANIPLHKRAPAKICFPSKLNAQHKESVKLIGSTLAFSSGGPWFKSRWGRNIFLLHFWVVIPWVPFTLELIHDYAKWWIHKWILNIWLSKRLNNLIAGHKTNWTKKVVAYLGLVVCGTQDPNRFGYSLIRSSLSRSLSGPRMMMGLVNSRSISSTGSYVKIEMVRDRSWRLLKQRVKNIKFVFIFTENLIILSLS